MTQTTADAGRTYRVWVACRKETTLEVMEADSSFIARRRMAERYGLKTFECIAQRAALAAAKGSK